MAGPTSLRVAKNAREHEVRPANAFTGSSPDEVGVNIDSDNFSRSQIIFALIAVQEAVVERQFPLTTTPSYQVAKGATGDKVFDSSSGRVADFGAGVRVNVGSNLSRSEVHRGIEAMISFLHRTPWPIY